MTGIDESWRDESVIQRNLYLLNSGFMADCTFVVGTTEKKRMQCHKFVLSQGSPVFYAMFNGELQEKGEVKMEDIEPQPFKKLLEFIYSDNTEMENVETALSVCYAANKYMINKLTLKCIDFIKTNMKADIVIATLEFARLIDNADLEAESLQYLKDNTSDVLKSASFPNAERVTLLNILSQDTYDTSEVDLFSACIRWAKAKRGSKVSLREALGPDVLSLIRFHTMTAQEFATVVVPSKLLQLQEEHDILCHLVTGIGNMPQGFNTNKENRFFLTGPRETVVIQSCPSRGDSMHNPRIFGTHHSYSSNARNGQQLNNEPITFTVNAECFFYGLQLGGLASSAAGGTMNSMGGFAFGSLGNQYYTHNTAPVEDKFGVNLMQGSELLACAEYEGEMAPGATVEVNFKKPVLLKANTRYTLQMNYSNLHTLYAGIEMHQTHPSVLCTTTGAMYSTEYITTTGVRMGIHYNLTSIRQIYIAKKI